MVCWSATGPATTLMEPHPLPGLAPPQSWQSITLLGSQFAMGSAGSFLGCRPHVSGVYQVPGICDPLGMS